MDCKTCPQISVVTPNFANFVFRGGRCKRDLSSELQSNRVCPISVRRGRKAIIFSVLCLKTSAGLLMKFYFDTNCVRRIAQVPESSKCAVVTSFLSVFETISGINSEQDFYLRRSVLKRLRERGVEIIWESPRSLLIRAFNLGEIDTDVKATEIMMDKIIELDSFDDLGLIKFRVGNSEEYTIDTFRQFDDSFSTEFVENIIRASRRLSKEERFECRGQELTLQSLPFFREMLVRDFLFKQLGLTDVEDLGYIKSANGLYQNIGLADYIDSILFAVWRALVKGEVAGRNDGFDCAHIMYAKHADYFVSDDKFYSRIPKEVSEVAFINFSDFEKICSE